MRLFRITLLLVTVWLMALTMSCSVQKRAQYHIKRARILDPTAFEIKRDTLIVVDTLEVAPVDFTFTQVKDSLIYITQYDTITKDSIRVKYLWRDKEVYLNVDCPDCEEKTKTITEKEYVFKEPTFWERGQLALPFIVGCVILLFFIVKKNQ